MGLENRIELRGIQPRRDVFKALSRSSIYIAASKWEGIGVANIEAAALGCWTFLSTIPPHEEIANLLNIPTYTIRYEDLIGNTENVMSKLLEFIDVPIDQKCFTTDPDNKEAKRNIR